MSNEDFIDNAIEVQTERVFELQKFGYNIVQCCKCGTPLIEKKGIDLIDCHGCANTVSANDCEDLHY